MLSFVVNLFKTAETLSLIDLLSTVNKSETVKPVAPNSAEKPDNKGRPT